MDMTDKKTKDKIALENEDQLEVQEDGNVETDNSKGKNSDKKISREKRKVKTKNKVRKSWIWSKYLMMKWRFRLEQARAIFGLLTFAVLLAIGYYEKIPWFNEINFWLSNIILTLIIFVVFVLGGYLYDRVFRLWTENTKVTIERNPYTYVPTPKEEIFTMGVYSFMISSLSKISKNLGIELEGEEAVKLMFNEYYSMNPETPEFEKSAAKIIELGHLIRKINIITEEDEANIDKYIAMLKEDLANAKKE